MRSNNTLFLENKHFNQVFLQHSKRSTLRAFPAQIPTLYPKNNLKLRLF
jgi:hypothetical protein